MRDVPILLLKKGASALLLLSLTNCASMTKGQMQSVKLETAPHKVSCVLKNDKGEWVIPETPGSIMVWRSNADLEVTCTHEGRKVSRSIPSEFSGSSMGNILAGGGIGFVVDHNSGAAYDYPSPIKIALEEKIETPIKEAIQDSETPLNDGSQNAES